jgi:hypothetical protein
MDPQPPTPPSFLPRPIDAPAAAGDAGPLVRRALLMPFLPRMWASAAHWRTGQVIAPLVVLILIMGGLLAANRSFGLRPELRKWAGAYDAAYPAVIIEKGEARVEGDRVIHAVEGNMTILVDPNETVPLDRITTPEYLVVRKHEIIRRQSFRTETTRLADLTPILGQGPTRIDGDALRSFDARWGLVLQVGLWVFLVLFVLVKESVGCTLYSLAAGGIVLGLRGRRLALDFPACVRVALAASGLAIVIHTALSFMGAGPGTCLGLLLWPALIAALALWAVGKAWLSVREGARRMRRSMS